MRNLSCFKFLTFSGYVSQNSRTATATIIQTAGGKQRQAIEVDDEGQVSGQTTPSKDKDARWTKKNGLYRLGYETTYPHRF